MKRLHGNKPVLALIVAILVVAVIAFVAIERKSRAPIYTAAGGVVKYQCSMHPQIIQDQPGVCPICHMDLGRVSVDALTAPASAAKLLNGEPRSPMAARRIVRYRNPMDPTVFSDRPTKDSMGMDFIPVYDDEAGQVAALASGVPGKAGFNLTEYRRQLIGVKWEKIVIRRFGRKLRLPGRATGGDRMTAQVLEIYAGLVKSGMAATVRGPQDQEVPATIADVDSNFDGLTRSYAVTVAASRSEDWLKPGVFCEVAVDLDFGVRLSVPVDAVVYSGERQVVFVTDGQGRFDPREVKLGREGEEWIEVVSGVKEGEQVVTAANFLIDSESRFQAALKQF
jgi:hypothetical protein